MWASTQRSPGYPEPVQNRPGLWVLEPVSKMPVLPDKSRLEHDNDEERSNEIGSHSSQLLQKATAIVEA